MAAEGVFITGTDTGAGKTHVACVLVRALRHRGVDAVGMKPVATGCRFDSGARLNDDVEALFEASGASASRSDINPCLYDPPMAPAFAAARAGEPIVPARILEAHARLASRHAFVVVEGIGGWRVPLSDDWDTTDLARALHHPVLLVVGLRLGCINHARLTHEALLADGVPLAGWVANTVDPDYDTAVETVEALGRYFGCMPSAVLPSGLAPVAVQDALVEVVLPGSRPPQKR